MGIFDDGYQEAITDAAREPAARVPAGFMDAFNASYESTRQEGLSISERQNYLDKVKIRNEKIQELTGQAPSISINADELLKPGQLSTTVELARQAYNRQVGELSAQHPEIKTDADILREIPEDSKRIREKADSVLSNTTFSGKIGSFTGAMAATMGDPLVLASIPFGASSSAGILKTALTEAGINMTSEALIQPFVYRYKKSIGSPYSVPEALTNVAAAGAAGAVFGGGVKAITRGVQRLHGIDDLLEEFERKVKEPTQIQRDAAHVLGDYSDILRKTPFEITPELDDIHLNAVSKAISDLDLDRPVDVQEFVSGIEPREDLRVYPKTIAGHSRAESRHRESEPSAVHQEQRRRIDRQGRRTTRRV